MADGNGTQDESTVSSPIPCTESSENAYKWSSQDATDAALGVAPGITLYVGKANTTQRTELQFEKGKKICHLTDKIQEDWKIDKKHEIVVQEPQQMLAIPAMESLDNYHEKQLTFYVPATDNLVFYISKIGAETSTRVECKYKDHLSVLKKKLSKVTKTDIRRICLYEHPEDLTKPLEDETSLHLLKKPQLVYRVKGIDVAISGVDEIKKTISICSDEPKIRDLKAELISSDLAKGKSLYIYKPTSIEGDISKPLSDETSLNELSKVGLIYYAKGEALPRGLEGMKKLACGQSIALFGAPSHGKSSTINTAGKAVDFGAFAQTYQKHVAATEVYTRHAFNIHNAKFVLWDVPGCSLAGSTKKLTKVLENIIKGKEPPNCDIGTQTGTSDPSRRIHAVVAIQNGLSDVEAMHCILRDVSKSFGQAVPMFIVITHIDLMTSEEVETKIDDLQKTIGLDRRYIFTIANATTSEISEDPDPQKIIYVRRVLNTILEASKRYKESLSEQDTSKSEERSGKSEERSFNCSLL